MDDGIGQVVKALKKNGVYDNSIIVFTSDNGEHLPSKANNGLFRDGKQSMYEGGLKVPTCISWPKKIESKSIIKNILTTIDLYPTLLEFAGIRRKETIEGESFSQDLLNTKEADSQERSLFFSRREGGQGYGGRAIYAVRKGDWKLLQNKPQQAYELYNLSNDPKEQHNLIQQHPKIYRDLNKALMRHIQKAASVPWQK